MKDSKTEQPKLPNLISAQELQAYLCCSKDTVYAIIKRRNFPSFKIGRKYYIMPDELSKWMEKQTKKEKSN